MRYFLHFLSSKVASEKHNFKVKLCLTIQLLNWICMTWYYKNVNFFYRLRDYFWKLSCDDLPTYYNYLSSQYICLNTTYLTTTQSNQQCNRKRKIKPRFVWCSNLINLSKSKNKHNFSICLLLHWTPLSLLTKYITTDTTCLGY